MCVFVFCFFKQKTAYEMRISDWSSDVCSSDLVREVEGELLQFAARKRCTGRQQPVVFERREVARFMQVEHFVAGFEPETCGQRTGNPGRVGECQRDLVARMKRGMRGPDRRSEEHTSELPSIMRLTYAVLV